MKKHVWFLGISCLFLMVVASSPALALRGTKPLPIDNRIQIMVYNPDDVFKFIGHYGYQSSIQFEDDETVDTISMGDTIAWQIVPAGNRIFLKPMEKKATTNMTVLTNKREYQFELHARDADEDGINDENMVFAVRFVYPESNNEGIMKLNNTLTGIDLSEPEKYNFDYTIAGSEFIAPVKIFDDAEFTYFEFRDKNAEVPGFFLVDSEGKEAIINYHAVGNYIVVERVASRFTLRNGADIVCIFNERMPYRKAKAEHSWWQFWK